MEFWSTIAGLIRRAVVIIPAVVVGLTLGTLAYLGTPKTYVSSTMMVLITTEYGGTETQNPIEPIVLTNPMLNFNAGLQTTSAILIQTLGTREVLEQLGATRGGTQLIVNDGRTDPDLLGVDGPFVYIEGRSARAEDARRIVADAQDLMQQKLGEWQRALNAPQKTLVSLVDVVSPTVPEADSGRAVKLGALAFLFGFLLCVGIAYFKHQIQARRRATAAATTPRNKAEPVVDPVTATKNEAEPAVDPVAPTTETQPAVPVRKQKAGSTVVPAPVKVNGRSRRR